MYAIEIQNLDHFFGDQRILKNLSMQVPKEKVCGFLGPNGSGKTTTIRLLLGLIRSTKGEIRINGRDIQSERRQALSSVGSIIESPTLYPQLTGLETLRMAADLVDAPQSHVDELIQLVGLDKVSKKKVFQYSLGMRQRLALARALIGHPSLLVLDEPTNGLDPHGIVEMRELLKSLPRRYGTTVFVSSHMLSEVQEISDHCVVIDQGRVIFQGSIEALFSDAPTTYLIKSSNDDKLSDILNVRDWKFIKTPQGIKCNLSEIGLNPSEFLKVLLDANCEVLAFSPLKQDLQSVFLSLTARGEIR